MITGWRKVFHAEVEKGKSLLHRDPATECYGKTPSRSRLEQHLAGYSHPYHRMKGDNALWLPDGPRGHRHPGQVEDELAKQGLSRQNWGGKSSKRVWAWKEEYGGTIIRQLKRLGSSCDWDRERFTMDEGCSRAVKEVFLRLYRKGLIYRGSYLVNWCPQCATTLSDIEVEHEEREGRLWHIRYPLADGSGYIQVATTRPETMLGDTAVAVHPDDERYRGLVGKKVILPLMKREIPILADPMVDREFGTGAVKITPAHDSTTLNWGSGTTCPRSPSSVSTPR